MDQYDFFGFVGLMYDDVLLFFGYIDVILSEVDMFLRIMCWILVVILLLLSVMDMVIELCMVIVMVCEGGIGILYCNLLIVDQVVYVDWVKCSELGMIIDLIMMMQDVIVEEVDVLCVKYCILGLLVVDDEGKLVGIIINCDMCFVLGFECQIMFVKDVMMSENFVIVFVGVVVGEVIVLFVKYCVEKFLFIDEDGKLVGFIIIKDFDKSEKYFFVIKDDQGCLCVGVVIGFFGDVWEWVEVLCDVGVDVFVVDMVNGQLQGVIDFVKWFKVDVLFEYIDIIGGNVVICEGVQVLIDVGVDVVKVGVGFGFICIMCVVVGVGVFQVIVVYEVLFVVCFVGVLVIVDGGLQYFGDIVKVFVVGVDVVMFGFLLVGIDEFLGEIVFQFGKQFKQYWGMGLFGVMQMCGKQILYLKDCYFQVDVFSDDKLIFEGIEGQVLYCGLFLVVVYQFVGGLCQLMFYVGVCIIEEFKMCGKFVCIILVGFKELYLYDVQIVVEVLNYKKQLYVVREGLDVCIWFFFVCLFEVMLVVLVGDVVDVLYFGVEFGVCVEDVGEYCDEEDDCDDLEDCDDCVYDDFGDCQIFGLIGFIEFYGGDDVDYQVDWCCDDCEYQFDD